MKNLFFLIAGMITLTAKSQTSVYHPFPDSAAIWNIESYQPCGLGFDMWKHSYSIIISGDTIINGINYHKLNVPVEVIESNGMCLASGSWTVSGRYAGCIRQDTSFKKVFYVPPSDSIEWLLYDFNMAVGDTVKGFTETNTFSPDVVQSIDSVLVGSSYRKRWNINPCYGIYFIEGIGSTYGLTEKSPGCLTDHSSFSIACFKQNGITLYPDTAVNCELITNVTNITFDKYPTIISPNPFTNNLNLKINNNEHSEFILYDISSRILFQLKFINSVSLNTEQFAKGLYLYEVRNKDGLSRKGKVVKE